MPVLNELRKVAGVMFHALPGFSDKDTKVPILPCIAMGFAFAGLPHVLATFSPQAKDFLSSDKIPQLLAFRKSSYEDRLNPDLVISTLGVAYIVYVKTFKNVLELTKNDYPYIMGRLEGLTNRVISLMEGGLKVENKPLRYSIALGLYGIGFTANLLLR